MDLARKLLIQLKTLQKAQQEVASGFPVGKRERGKRGGRGGEEGGKRGGRGGRGARGKGGKGGGEGKGEGV